MATSHAFNHRPDKVFPVQWCEAGDDGKRKPFHVLRCMLPGCEVPPLRIATGHSGCMAVEQVIKLALQRGWFADRKGYVLCGIHRLGQRPRKRPEMPPEQRSAAFNRIRADHMALASGERHAALKPCGSRGARMTQSRLAVLRAIRDGGRAMTGAEIAAASHHPIHNVQNILTRLHRDGLVERHGLRPYRYTLPAKESEPMPEATLAPPMNGVGPTPEPPRQPTIADNRRIRDHLDQFYDQVAGRWAKDWCDEKSAQHLRVPRAWISTMRGMSYGPDESEAGLQATREVTELVQTAMRLKDDALAIATRAEALERAGRKLLGIAMP